jgi:hypothetical protein
LKRIVKRKAELDSVIKSQGAKCSHNKRAMSGWLQLVIGRGRMDLEGIDESKIQEKDPLADVLMEDDGAKPVEEGPKPNAQSPKPAAAEPPKGGTPNTK